MKWISSFFNLNIPFYIYKLKKNDAIIENKNNQQEKTIIILYGAINLVQIFSNQEILPITILHKNHILDINNNPSNTKSYYKINALKETYLICFYSHDIHNNNFINEDFLKYYLIYYKLTLENQKMMNYILIQKNTQYRIIQLIIFFSLQFGIIYEEFIKIPFKIRKRDMAIMSGSNINTINKTFDLLQVYKIIKYSKKQLILVKNSFLIQFMYLLS